MGRQQSSLGESSPAAAVETADAVDISERFSILLVDDSRVSLRGMVRVLRQNWDVDIATDSDEALQLVNQRTYSVIITDCDMPGHNGLWLLEQIKNVSPQTIRVLASAGLHERFAPHIKAGLIHVFLHKPLVNESLRTMLIGLMMR
ncbi:MAG: response regulator [Deltaproteobacteria bacterium]|nr:response regulator [Deltaproteobacteria bacterium]